MGALVGALHDQYSCVGKSQTATAAPPRLLSPVRLHSLHDGLLTGGTTMIRASQAFEQALSLSFLGGILIW